jgi:hypothetical protein
VGRLGGLGNVGTQGLCVDRNGDVFVPAWTFDTKTTGYVYEFAHGGTEPIETLTDGKALNTSCSVDPTTGNLAVTDFANVEIFQNAQGTPTAYVVPNIQAQWSAYDDDGNLFVDGYPESTGTPLAELVKGSSAFTPVTLNQSISTWSLQWDNGFLTIASTSSASSDAEYVYRVQVSDGTGTIVGTSTLKTHHLEYDGNGQVWIQGGRVMGAGRKHDALDLWRYPIGGKGSKGNGQASYAVGSRRFRRPIRFAHPAMAWDQEPLTPGAFAIRERLLFGPWCILPVRDFPASYADGWRCNRGDTLNADKGTCNGGRFRVSVSPAPVRCAAAFERRTNAQEPPGVDPSRIRVRRDFPTCISAGICTDRTARVNLRNDTSHAGAWLRLGWRLLHLDRRPLRLGSWSVRPSRRQMVRRALAPYRSPRLVLD